ncbi:MAG TPA: hypothetical protein VHJ76_03655 [Actinomycetota bacterium]|nr:hypothetical protein [Actinomycetota bacterium]
MTDPERAARYSDLFGDRRAHEHPSDSAYCPFCATVNVVRKTHPEVLEHLAAAARELITAAGILVEEAAKAVAPPPAEETEGEPAPVRRIEAV